MQAPLEAGPPRPAGAAARLAEVLSPVIPEVGDLARRTPGTLSLAQGMVDWGPPEAVERAVAEALRRDGDRLHRYGPMAGEPELLEAIRRKLLLHNRLDLDAGVVLVTAGSNMAFNAMAQVICDPLSEVILPVPYYFNHAMAIQLAGGVPVAVEAGLIPDPQRLAAAITSRTRAIVTISPNNPSGVVVPAAILREINTLCAHHGLFHIHDEAYEQFVHGSEPHVSPGSLAGSSSHTISLHSLSKAYGMAGWRLGYAAVPRQLMAALAKVQDTVLICPPLLNQRAALAALAAGPAWCAPRIAALAERRSLLLATIDAARREGLPCRLLAEPDGAFYALLSIDAGDRPPTDSDTVMRRLVLEHRVATLSGVSFGLGRHGAAIRLSYGMLAGSELEDALGRLVNGLRALR